MSDRSPIEADVALVGGAWQPDRTTVLRWTPEDAPNPPMRDDVHLLIACPTCRAKVDETCKAQGRADGTRARSIPHRGRLAPRLCRCGSRLAWKRQLCDACRVVVNRANKRDYMRRQRDRVVA